MKFKASCDFSEQVSVFDTLSVSTVDVVAAGNNYLVCLYNGKPVNGLNSLWYNCVLQNKVATIILMYIQPQSLPPTSAVKYQSLYILPCATVEVNRIYSSATRLGMKRE